MEPSNKTDPDDLLTVAEAARMLDLTPDGVRHLANQGKLPVKLTSTGRRIFRRGDVEALVKTRKQ